MEEWQQIEQDILSKLDNAANLSAADYKTVVESILSDCETRLEGLNADEANAEAEAEN